MLNSHLIDSKYSRHGLVGACALLGSLVLLHGPAEGSSLPPENVRLNETRMLNSGVAPEVPRVDGGGESFKELLRDGVELPPPVPAKSQPIAENDPEECCSDPYDCAFHIALNALLGLLGYCLSSGKQGPFAKDREALRRKRLESFRLFILDNPNYPPADDDEFLKYVRSIPDLPQLHPVYGYLLFGTKT